MVEIAPSILSADFGALRQDVQDIEAVGTKYLHIDIMDGNFVANISFGPLVVEAIRADSQMVFDCHLMIANPEQYVQEIAEAGADIITVHVESTHHIHGLIQQIKNLGKQAGIVLNPGTPLSAIEPVLHLVDLVLVMSVNPGFGGQSFIPESVERIKAIKAIRQANNYDFLIEVDGGINGDTAKLCAQAGADILVSGSYLFNQADLQQAVTDLHQVVN